MGNIVRNVECMQICLTNGASTVMDVNGYRVNVDPTDEGTSGAVHMELDAVGKRIHAYVVVPPKKDRIEKIMRLMAIAVYGYIFCVCHDYQNVPCSFLESMIPVYFGFASNKPVDDQTYGRFAPYLRKIIDDDTPRCDAIITQTIREMQQAAAKKKIPDKDDAIRTVWSSMIQVAKWRF